MKINPDEFSYFLQHRKDNEIFSKFYMQYNPLVKRIAFSVVKNEFESEDISQLVFTKIYSMAETALPSSHYFSWLYTVTKNTAIDFIKNQKNTLNLDNLYTISDSQDFIGTTLDTISYNQIIEKLPPKEQEIVSLKLLSNLSFKEIGELLGLPTSTVSWLYYKSLKNLKFFLGDFFLLIIAFYLLALQRSPQLSSIKGNSALDVFQQSFAIRYLLLIATTLLLACLIYSIYIFYRDHKKFSQQSSKEKRS